MKKMNHIKQVNEVKKPIGIENTKHPSITRRSLLIRGTFFSSSIFFCLPRKTEAKDKRIQKAEALTKNIFQSIFKVIGGPGNEYQKRNGLVKLFEKHADVPIIARAVLGSPWRQLNSVERANFIDAFRQYLAKKYTAQISEFLGAKMMIERSRDSGSKAGIMVETRLLMPGSSPIKVGWQVSDATGRFKMIDVKIEGISLLTTERGEIRNQLSKEGGSISRLSTALLNY